MKKENFRFKFLDCHEIQAYQDKLAQFEKGFTYPLNHQRRFLISHGEEYSAFFSRIGEPRFLLLFDRNQIVGTICAVKKLIRFKQREFTTLYVSDLKVSKDYQGKKLSQRMYWNLLTSALKRPFGWRWSLCYFVGMVGREGDISRTFKGSVLEKVIRPFAQILIYFVEPEKLASLPQDHVDTKNHEEGILDLSSSKRNGIISNLEGIKDIVLENKTPFRLAHVNAGNLTGVDLIQRLKLAGERSKGKFQSCCFALDLKRTEFINWLRGCGIETSSKAVVGGFSLRPLLSGHQVISINTDEI